MYLPTKYSKKSDCDVLFDGVENVFNDLGSCVEDTFDERKSKMSVVGGLFKLGKSLTKLTFDTGVCVVKNTPKAVVAVAAVKREIVSAVEEEVHEYSKQQKEDALNERIRQLKLKA